MPRHLGPPFTACGRWGVPFVSGEAGGPPGRPAAAHLLGVRMGLREGAGGVQGRTRVVWGGHNSKEIMQGARFDAGSRPFVQVSLHAFCASFGKKGG